MFGDIGGMTDFLFLAISMMISAFQAKSFAFSKVQTFFKVDQRSQRQSNKVFPVPSTLNMRKE